MQQLVQDVWATRRPLARWHVGDLAWERFQHVGREPEWPTRLWDEDGRVVAWGWLRLPGELDLLVGPGRPELLDEVLDWFEAVASDDLGVAGLAEDGETVDRLRRRGYASDPDAPWFALLLRGLEDLPEPSLPAGYALRTVEGGDVECRVAVHRAVFEPSRVTVESYRNVIGAWPYRGDLDCVVEAADGSFGAFALAWLDAENRVGALEPVGTHPTHRRLGLGRAVSLFALARLRKAGATHAVVQCRGDEGYPVPKRLYESVGLRPVARVLRYRR
jgi:GNAT superfamily N-acetyltransferase